MAEQNTQQPPAATESPETTACESLGNMDPAPKGATSSLSANENDKKTCDENDKSDGDKQEENKTTPVLKQAETEEGDQSDAAGEKLTLTHPVVSFESPSLEETVTNDNTNQKQTEENENLLNTTLDGTDGSGHVTQSNVDPDPECEVDNSSEKTDGVAETKEDDQIDAAGEQTEASLSQSSLEKVDENINQQQTGEMENTPRDGAGDSDPHKELHDTSLRNRKNTETKGKAESAADFSDDKNEQKPANEVENIKEPGYQKYLIMAGVVILTFSLLGWIFFQQEPSSQHDDKRHIDVFLRQMEKLKTQFSNQRPELWSRSKIHLKRHLELAQPTEPVSLILTAGVKAGQTLHCLAQALATAFSSARNGSVLHISGSSRANQDSDVVKLDIDSQLREAFEGDKHVAVIHRFEELPPGSTLIFYRYCDHENAAYKKTFLLFTVLLSEEEEIPAKRSLSAVEEMVDDHLRKKFLSGDHPVSFDKMDIDKYGGLWSRISHLILPVMSEERMEHIGCKQM
ncbi:uncharacterized protein V6R79_013947 [Siganus canaliculatus]